MSARRPAPKPGDRSGADRPDEIRGAETDDDAIEIEVEDEAWRGVVPDAPALARQAAEAALGARRDGAMVVLLTGDDAVRDLNRRFRGRDAATNVLAFPAAPSPAGVSAGPRPLGDIAVAFGVCESEARGQGKPLADHLRHLVAHGVLHLLGHDHQEDDEARIMEDLERRILAGIGVPDPYAQDLAQGHRPSEPRDGTLPAAPSHDHVAEDTPRHVE